MGAHESLSRIFDGWISRSELRFSCGIQGYPREHCFAYLSSERGERCQIEVEAPALGVVTVHVRDIEAVDGDGLDEVWRVTLPELNSTLNEATNLVERWLARHRR